MPGSVRAEAALRNSRRQILKAGAGAVGAGAALGGLAGRALGAPAPGSQAGLVELIFQPNTQGVSYNKTFIQICQEFVDTTFNAKNKGLRATLYPGGWGDPSGVIVQSVAGKGFPDVVESCCDDFATYAQGNWMLPLDAYLKQDNIPLSSWSLPHVQALSAGGHNYGLPSYDGPGIVAYRQDVLDSLGLAYPDPSWTYQEAAKLWEQCAQSTYAPGKKRRGISFLSLDDGHINWWMHAWKGLEMDATATHCLVDSPEGVGALTWLANLQTSGVAASDSGEVGRLKGAASAAFAMVGGWDVFDLATQMGTGVKWDLLPVPTFPGGRATYDNIDFYAINRASAHPEEAWLLLKYLTYETQWQVFQMTLTLIQPCLNSLWSQWQSIVEAAAPPLKGKQLQWYQDAAQKGYAWPTIFFAYNAIQAGTIIASGLNRIGAGTVSPTSGLTEMTQQVDALVAAGQQEQAASAGLAKRFPSNGPAMASVLTGI